MCCNTGAVSWAFNKSSFHLALTATEELGELASSNKIDR